MRSTCERHNAFPDDPIQMRGGWVLDRERLYGDGNARARRHRFRRDLRRLSGHVAHPARGSGVLRQRGGRGVRRRHTFTTEGSFPINTSGGQLSVGQAGCAAGFLGLVESVRQLTGRNLARPVPDARFGLAVGFGMITYDRGLCSGAAVLARG